MKPKQHLLGLLASLLFMACENKANITTAVNSEPKQEQTSTTSGKELKFRCAITNGMKGDSLFFTVSADRKKLSDLTFKGNWRCSGTLTQETAAGPEGSFEIVDNKVDGTLSEPPNGGSTAWRFELHAELKNKTVSGTFRMNINNLGCDSYVLKFDGAAL